MKLKCPSLFSLILKFTFGLVLFCSVHAETEDKSLRVMSYNIHRGGVVMLKQPLSQTAKAIQLAKADIVGIQETRSPSGVTNWRSSPSYSDGIMTWARAPTF